MSELFSSHKAGLLKVMSEVKEKAGSLAVNFFNDSWTNKGFTDKSLSPWKPVIDRKTKKEKQTPLVVSGDLRRSVDYEMESGDVVVYTDEIYGEYHNEGGKTPGRPPKRQFMGESEVLETKIENLIIDELDKIFR